MTETGAGRLVTGHGEEDEERGQLLSGQLLTVDLGVDQRREQIVGGLRAPQRADLVEQAGQRRARLEERHDRVGPLGDELGVAAREDDVGLLEHEIELAVGDPHHVEDHQQRERHRHVAHEVDLTLVDHRVDDPRRRERDLVEHLVEHAGSERARDDAPQTGMARIVHRDHRTEVLVHLGRHVEDRHRAST